MADTDELFAHFAAPGRKPARRHALRAWCSTRRGSSAAWPAASRCSAWASRPARPTAGRTPAWASRRRTRRIIAMAQAGRRRRQEGAGLGAVGLRLRLRGPGRRGARARHRAALPRGGLRSISLADTAGHAHPTQVERALRRDPRARRRRSSAPATSTTPTASAWPTVYAAHARPACTCFETVVRRPRRLPVHQGRGGQRLHRGPGPRAAAQRPAHGHRPRGARRAWRATWPRYFGRDLPGARLQDRPDPD